MFTLIACVGKNRELGKDGTLVFRMGEDMQFFRETTMNHKVLMGRKTWESLPVKLQGRVNLVVSHGEVTGADEVIHDLERFVAENRDSREEIFVIGGAEIYRELLPAAERMYLTEVEGDAEADTFFPKFNRGDWERTVLKKGFGKGFRLEFAKYERRRK